MSEFGNSSIPKFTNVILLVPVCIAIALFGAPVSFPDPAKLFVPNASPTLTQLLGKFAAGAVPPMLAFNVEITKL